MAMKNDNLPMVDIVIPTYKRPKLLQRALESVLNQTYPNIVNIIVTDDSNDDAETMQLIKNFQLRDPRILYVYDDRYLHCPARNKNNGIDHVESEFFLILDDDDWLEGSATEEMVCIAARGNYDIVFANCIDERGNFMGEHHGKSEEATYKDFICGYFDGEYVWLVRTSAFGKIRFNDKLIYGEHVVMWKVLDGKKIFHLHKPFRYYNTQGVRITTAPKKNPERFFDIWYETCTIFEDDFLQWCPRRLQKYLMLLAYHSVLAGRKEETRKIIKEVYIKDKNIMFLVPLIVLYFPANFLVLLRSSYTVFHLAIRNARLRLLALRSKV